MEDETTSFSGESVASAFARVDFTQEEAASGPVQALATTPADEEPAANDQDLAEDDGAEDVEQPEGDRAFNPEGPGNIKAALKQAREEAKALKDANAQTAARLAALENERAQERAAILQRQQAAQRQQVLEELHPDDVPAYIEQERQREAQTLHQQAQWNRLADSATALRRALPEGEFDTQLGKLTAAFGLDFVNAWAVNQAHPAIAVLDVAKSFYTQADITAAEERGRKAALEALPNHPNRKQSAAPRLANIPTNARTRDADPQERLSQRLKSGNDVEGTARAMFSQAFTG